jgi:hypothetical protein
MNTHTALRTTLLACIIGASAAGCTGQTSSAQDAPRPTPDDVHTALQLAFKTPKLGETVTGADYTATLTVGNELERRTLKVLLNGKDVTSGVTLGRCSVLSCDVTVALSAANGLRPGENRLGATVHGADGRVANTRVKFDGTTGLLGAGAFPSWLPSSVGLSVTPGGAEPWVTITTGTPAALVDTTDTTQYALPYPDTTFPLTTDPSCASQTYQVLVLDRKQPLFASHTYSCYNDSASLKTYLTGLPSSDLVIVGTSYGYNVAENLDTSSIGGTDYGSTIGLAPLGYVAIGVPGAPAGSAYENYYLSTDKAPLLRTPFAHGLLALDKWGNYNFYSDTAYQFLVAPANNGSGLGPVVDWSLQTGNTGLYVREYAPPNNVDGFWLLVLDRVTLEAADATVGSCPYGSGGTCGAIYETGSTDAPTATAAMASLATAIHAITPRQLAFLVSTGQPFQSSTAVSSDLADAVAALGGSRYTLSKLTSPESTFSLVAPGPHSPLTLIPDRSPFAEGVVESSNALTQQGQTGMVRGLFERDQYGLYRPTDSSQEDGIFNGTNATSLSQDFSFHQIADYATLDWPLTDTSNHIAAYHAVSAQYLSVNYGETGSHSQDLRYFYAGQPTKFSSAHETLNDQGNGNCLATQKVPSGSSFTLQDWCDARAQLYAETLALYNSDQYLGATGIGGLIDGTSGMGSIAGDVVGVAQNIVNGQLLAPKPLTGAAAANAKVSQWLNFASAAISLAAIGIDPSALPFVTGAMSAASGGLKLGAAFSVFDGSSPPLSYENGFDTTLASLEANADTYQENLVSSYGQALDAVYSDWGKLSAVGAKTADSDSGWSSLNQVSKGLIGSILATGTARSLYAQALPQFYELDTYQAQPVSTIGKIGMLSYDAVTAGWSCVATYPSKIKAQNFSVFPTPGSTTASDVYVIGGTIIDQNNNGVTESLPSTVLLNTLFSAPNVNDGTTAGYLNIPTDYVYAASLQSGGYLTYRSGPSQGNGICYKPGCQADNKDPCVGP